MGVLLGKAQLADPQVVSTMAIRCGLNPRTAESRRTQELGHSRLNNIDMALLDLMLADNLLSKTPEIPGPQKSTLRELAPSTSSNGATIDLPQFTTGLTKTKERVHSESTTAQKTHGDSLAAQIQLEWYR